MLQIAGNSSTSRNAPDLLRKFGHSGWACAALLLLAGCGGGFYYEQLSFESYAATQKVEWLTHEPLRPYVILASFRGSEMSWCARSEPNCSLIKEARQRGAEAIWVQRTNRSTRPEQWVDIQGRMTRIPPQTFETLQGVLIRYK